MNKEEIQNQLIGSIREVQKLNGYPREKIEANTKPLDDLTNFDSLCAVEATVMLSELLKKDIEGDVNLFVSNKGDSLSVSEIARRIHNLLSKKEKH